jgi:hypothetical protein
MAISGEKKGPGPAAKGVREEGWSSAAPQNDEGGGVFQGKMGLQ